MYEREQTRILAGRLREPRRFIQILFGPRQVGKTTSLRQATEALTLPLHYATADTALLQSGAWLEEQWATARQLQAGAEDPVILALDEVQKIAQWSSHVKRLWDEDSFAGRDIRVVLAGSSPILLQEGLSESLAGRFETIQYTHWLWPECRDAFGWDLDTFIYYGGYPGSAGLIHDPVRWRSYILDSIVETTVSRDILLMSRIEKPALLRRVFNLACEYSGRELTYEKMVGALEDVGNTTTVAAYLDLLDTAGLVAALPKYAGDQARRRRSTPKLAVHNTALMNAVGLRDLEDVRRDPAAWGRLVESAVGAHLLARARLDRTSVGYWRTKISGRDAEVDFVVSGASEVKGIEVKSGASVGSLEGLAAFRTSFGDGVQTQVVGAGGTPLETFLSI